MFFGSGKIATLGEALAFQLGLSCIQLDIVQLTKGFDPFRFDPTLGTTIICIEIE